ncbi:hypothetical protein K525DRAFT_268991 [Schizophyllum commune Loenen D]|nr:hypothetical protein K525DRAFT_268991 [Schizophyllum commune Loenen D]
MSQAPCVALVQTTRQRACTARARKTRTILGVRRLPSQQDATDAGHEMTMVLICEDDMNNQRLVVRFKASKQIIVLHSTARSILRYISSNSISAPSASSGFPSRSSADSPPAASSGNVDAASASASGAALAPGVWSAVGSGSFVGAFREWLRLPRDLQVVRVVLLLGGLHEHDVRRRVADSG